MKTGKPSKYGIGWIIVDCLLLFEVLRDIRAGRLALNEWYTIVLASIILGILLVAVFKKRIKKERAQCRSASKETQTNDDGAEN